MNNKKILALVLAFAMILSSVSVVFADTPATIGADAAALKTMGVLQGDDGGVTSTYLAKETTRMQAAIMYLRLKGLEDEAKAFTGTTNFADANTMAWSEGKAMMAYLKANPQLGWVGDGTNFNPLETITAQQYYKVMLEALGYKQTTAEVVGDFSWADVLTFAASKGLVKAAGAAKFTNNDVAVATIEALKTNTKAAAKTLAEVMVDAGMINKAAAVEAGVYEEAPVLTAAVKSAKATGNTAVEVTFASAVDADAANAALYTIAGLEVKSAAVTGTKTAVLETAAQTTGKVYTMTVGEKNVTFAGVAKVSGAPTITDSKSEDVEEVVLTFDKNIEVASGTNAANYTIAGVEIAKAEVDENEVTLTTVGLKDDANYTVKATNIKSIDGVARKSTTDTFRSNYDTLAPKVDSTNTEVQTNQRIMLHFNEDVTKETAENIANYSIKVNETDGAELEIISATQDADDENIVEIVTEAMEKNESYKLTVNNIADQRKVANVMTRPSSYTFKGLAEDDDAPQIVDATVIAKNLIVLELSDDSKIDEASATDLNNYTFVKGSDTLDVEAIETIENENGIFRALVTVTDMEAGKNYDLKVLDVTDEFGNAMKEDTERVSPALADFASATLTGIAVDSKAQLTLTFNKELVEASAENIANYSIDGGIGSPLKATYNVDSNTVVLAVNTLTNGEEYDVTVNGVTDLAGNVINLTKKNIVATAGSVWDDEDPELTDAYAVDKNVAALEFSEKVVVPAGTTLTLEDENGVQTVLTFKALTEDDTVAEFSLFGDIDGNPATPDAWFVLDENMDYTVAAVAGAITDLAGRDLAAIEDEFSFAGSDNDPEYAEVDSYDQINGGTFEVTMSRNVDFYMGAGTDVTVVGGVYSVDDADGNNFVVEIDEDDANVVRFIGDIAEDGEYDFDLTKIFTDEHGMAAINSDDTTTTLVGEETDEDAPYITDVEATDRLNIEITFSEDIKTAAAANFKIENLDTEKNVSIASIDIDGNVVTLTLNANNALEGRYEYELTMTDDVLDFAGNNSDADSFSFDGSDLAPIGF